MRPSSNPLRAVALVVALVTLGGCSEYLDRRDTIALAGGDAVMTNRVTQMVDPWPLAYTRYRTGKVIPPVGTGTGTAYQPPPTPAPNNATPVGPTVTQPAAAVK